MSTLFVRTIRLKEMREAFNFKALLLGWLASLVTTLPIGLLGLLLVSLVIAPNTTSLSAEQPRWSEQDWLNSLIGLFLTGVFGTPSLIGGYLTALITSRKKLLHAILVGFCYT